ncbi:MAG: hypothetical protein HC939_08135 [Pleurocapsa sp. SU_5_0]|nr:hypothetical protein [Pleurocapsa sp. SU_5_0]NJO98226.1 hypothetical protein [Pleurocapsa sp. CRU_1_2]
MTSDPASPSGARECASVDRYGRRVENYRLPKLDSQRENLGNQMGEDGLNLLQKIYASNAP